MRTIRQIIPEECFRKDPVRAWGALVMNYAVIGAGYGLLAVTPAFLAPPILFVVGTGFAGLFMLAHDCGHRSFHDERWVNDVVGQILLLPLLYPFENWRIRHNCHHANTNRLGETEWRQLLDVRNRKADNAWFPLQESLWKRLGRRQRIIYWLSRGPLWWIAFVYNWGVEELVLDPRTPLSPRERVRVRRSLAAVVGFALVFFPLLFHFTGFRGVVLYWLVPWLVYHFWASTFTRIHHSSPDIRWFSGASWNAAETQVLGTVHCRYPRWVETLCHHINVHIPHHVSVAIPHYHLSRAHESLRQAFGDQLRETRFGWKLFRLMGTLHLYDEQTGKHRAVGLREVLFAG